MNVRYTAGAPADYIFTADIYAFAARRHPDRHLGWWCFELPPDRREAALVMDFDPIRPDSVALSVNGATIPATDKWHNPEYAFDPLGDQRLTLVMVRPPSPWEGCTARPGSGYASNSTIEDSPRTGRQEESPTPRVPR